LQQQQEHSIRRDVIALSRPSFLLRPPSSDRTRLHRGDGAPVPPPCCCAIGDGVPASAGALLPARLRSLLHCHRFGRPALRQVARVGEAGGRHRRGRHHAPRAGGARRRRLRRSARGRQDDRAGRLVRQRGERQGRQRCVRARLRRDRGGQQRAHGVARSREQGPVRRGLDDEAQGEGSR
jgi:hypothetical protein